eukprot:TRINITY_DN14199_c0_g1_i1.p1 TRINITY_DN14199_c0_g1~~TRINITY_DN14199_c0_g1_i1.p1  ORF type:complete len:559 (-),score=71.71 TRINITY_DN14199_c0_g1_i1:449-2125(-)
MPEQRQRRKLDRFLSELEDTLRKDREDGRPVRSLRGFADVARRAARSSKPLPFSPGPTLAFLPEPLGITVEPLTGRVMAVVAGSQAERCGVRVDWHLDRLNGLMYRNELLSRLEKGKAPFVVKFKILQAATVNRVFKTDHGKYLIAHPDGFLKPDSTNANGDWEKFELIPTLSGKFVIRSHHGKYWVARADGTLTADGEDERAEGVLFDVLSGKDGKVILRSCYEKYVIAHPNGKLKVDSQNKHGTWEMFEMLEMEKDFICKRQSLFEYIDRLSEEGKYFQSVTYVVNQWNLGGVLRLKHHACILTEVGGQRFLKFDFGRWGIDWFVSDEYPEHPKGTCRVQTHEIVGDPQLVKRYCVEMQPFSWTENNCATFTRGLIKALCETDKSSKFDCWPKWCYVLACPPVKMPSRSRRKICRERSNATTPESAGDAVMLGEIANTLRDSELVVDDSGELIEVVGGRSTLTLTEASEEVNGVPFDHIRTGETSWSDVDLRRHDIIDVDTDDTGCESDLLQRFEKRIPSTSLAKSAGEELKKNRSSKPVHLEVLSDSSDEESVNV